MAKNQLNQKDTKIIKLLKDNSRIPARKLSEEVDVSLPTIYSRVKNLEKSGIIKNFTIGIDYSKLGKKICALMGLNVPTAKVQDLVSALTNRKEVYEIYITNGPSNVMLKVRVEDLDKLKGFIQEISSEEDIYSYQIFIVMESILDEATSPFKDE
ncbi:MAG: Lrp/AsnC family transcriptional regulator [Candidatus Hodarchaeales archaeon]|jgi:DNA-binding Lrp family transcriptional regulator